MGNNLSDRIGPMKPAFLSLTPVSVLLGWAVADWQAGGVSMVQLWWAFIGAVASHISVNAFNEYLDFRSGLDSRTQRTPFSGGTGTLPEVPGNGAPGLGHGRDYPRHRGPGWSLLPLGARASAAASGRPRHAGGGRLYPVDHLQAFLVPHCSGTGFWSA